MGRYYMSTLFTILLMCCIGCGTYFMIKCSSETLNATANLINEKSFEHKMQEAIRLIEDDGKFEMSSNMSSAREALRKAIEEVEGARVNAALTKNNTGDFLDTLGNALGKWIGADDESKAGALLEQAQAAFEIDFSNYVSLREKDDVFKKSMDSELGIWQYKKWIIIGAVIFGVYMFLVIIPLLLTRSSGVPKGQVDTKNQVPVQQAYPQIQPIFLQVPSNYYQQPEQAQLIKQEVQDKPAIQDTQAKHLYEDVSKDVLSSLCEKYGLQKDYVLGVYKNDEDKACARLNMYAVSCGDDPKRILSKIRADEGGGGQ